MENSSMRLGLVAVVAVSGSMAFLVHQVHKRLLSNFMEKFEHEMGGVLYARNGQKNLCGSEKHQAKRKVRFAKEALGNNSCRKRDKMVKIRVRRFKAEEIGGHGPKLEDMMPPNRAALYKGIMKYRKRSIYYGRLRF